MSDLIEDTKKIFISRVVSALSGIIFIVLITKIVSPELLGSFFIFQALLAIGSFVTDGGLRDSLERKVSAETNPKAKLSWLSSCLSGQAILIFISISAIFVLSEELNQYAGAYITIYLGISLILRQISMSLISYNRGKLNIGSTAKFNAIYQLSWVGFGMVIVYWEPMVESLIIGVILGEIIRLIWVISEVKFQIVAPNFNMFIKLCDYGKNTLVSGLGGHVFNWLDVALIAYFLSNTAVSGYEISWRVAGVVMLLSNSLGTVVYPRVSNWESKGQFERISKTISDSTMVILSVVIPAFLGTIILSDELLTIFFSEEYSSYSFVLITLMAGKIFESLRPIYSRTLNGIGLPEIAAKATLLGIGINLVGNIVLINLYGVLGAAVVSAATTTVMVVLLAMYVHSNVGLEFRLRLILWIALSSFVMGISTTIIKIRIDVEGYLDVVTIIVFGVLVYSITLLTHPEFRRIMAHFLYKGKIS